MPIFFQGVPGRTAALPDVAAQGSVTLVTLDPNFDWANQRSIITGVGVALQGNYQFLHTLGNDVYIYAFGDRVGSVTISGLSMAADCNSQDTSHGAEMALEWYNENRLASRREPIRVTIGLQTVIEGFLVGTSGDIVDPASRLFRFSYQLAVIPEKP